MDVLVKAPIDFETAYRRRVVADVLGHKVPVASIADIIIMKTGTGRAKDRDDIAMLQRLGELDGTRE